MYTYINSYFDSQKINPFCSVSYINILKTHLEMHFGEKPFSCKYEALHL